jgi:ubiquinone/menaquinone biosynthesis C-methylase UbiE
MVNMSKGYKKIYEENYQAVRESENYTAIDRPYYYPHVRRFKSICQQVLSSRPRSILDVGCGDGAYGIFFGSRSISYVGADIALINLKRLKQWATERKLDIPMVLCDAQYLPFQNDTFDVVLCSEVIEHMLELDLALSELNRASKKTIIISTPCMGFPLLNDLFTHFVKKENARVRFEIDSAGTYQGLSKLLRETTSLHIRIFTLPLLREIFKENNLNMVKVQGAGFSIPFLPIRQSTLEHWEDDFLNKIQLFLMPKVHIGYIFAIFTFKKTIKFADT